MKMICIVLLFFVYSLPFVLSSKAVVQDSNALVCGVEAIAPGQELSAGSIEGALGQQKALVFVLRFKGNNDMGPPDSQIRSIFQTDSLSLANYWKELSGSQTRLTKVDISRPHSITASDLQIPNTPVEARYATAELEAAHITYEEFLEKGYNRIFVIIPINSGVDWGGYSSPGYDELWIADTTGRKRMVQASCSVLRSDYFTTPAVLHEAEHGIGMWHSYVRTFGNKPLGNFHERGTITSGDLYSVMDIRNVGVAFPCAYQRALVGWLHSDNIPVVTPEQNSVVYKVVPRECKPLKKDGSARIMALKIARVNPSDGSRAYLYLEFVRYRGAFDSRLQSSSGFIGVGVEGALIYYVDEYSGQEGNLLSFNNNPIDMVLHVGSRWHDKYSDLNIEVLSVSNTGMSVRVTYGGQ